MREPEEAVWFEDAVEVCGRFMRRACVVEDVGDVLKRTAELEVLGSRDEEMREWVTYQLR